MLATGDLVPHFTVHTVNQGIVSYASIWQRRALVLIALPDDLSLDESALALARAIHDDTACVITRDDVQGVPRPGVLVADRWGEIAWVTPIDGGRLPAADIQATVDHLRAKCPECEGEAR